MINNGMQLLCVGRDILNIAKIRAVYASIAHIWCTALGCVLIQSSEHLLLWQPIIFHNNRFIFHSMQRVQFNTAFGYDNLLSRTGVTP